MLQVAGEGFQPLFQLVAQRMVGIDQHFGQQLVKPVEDGIGQPLVQPGEAQQRIRPVVDHVADHRLVVFQHQPGPADRAVDQRQVLAVRHGDFHHPPEQRRDLDPFELAGETGADLRAEPFGIERFEQFGEQLGRTGADARRPFPARFGQEIACRPGEVHVLHPPRHDLRDEEILAQEDRHRVGDAVLVLRDDRRVRDRQAERAAEQGGDREPVRQSADKAGLGKGMDIAPCPVRAFEPAGDEEYGGHHHQHAGGGDPHPAGAVLQQGRSGGGHGRGLFGRLKSVFGAGLYGPGIITFPVTQETLA